MPALQFQTLGSLQPSGLADAVLGYEAAMPFLTVRAEHAEAAAQADDEPASYNGSRCTPTVASGTPT